MGAVNASNAHSLRRHARNENAARAAPRKLRDPGAENRHRACSVSSSSGLVLALAFAGRARFVERRKEVDIMTNCSQCGGEMQRVLEKRTGGIPLPAIGLFIVGFILLFFFPAGTAIGGFLIIAALLLGYPRKRAWKCGACGFQHV